MSWIIAEIEMRGGAVPFDQFMELALYHPEHGYYTGERPRYGRAGDFLTAPTASEWYPRVISRLAGEISVDLGALHLLDVASGDGAFLGSVLEAIGSAAEGVVSEITSVERSPGMRLLQERRFEGSRIPVVICEKLSPDPAGSAATLIHASELYDALPVVRVIGRSGGIEEMWVAAGDEGLVWSTRDPREQVAVYFERHGVVLAEGQIAEAHLQARTTHRDLLGGAGEDGLALVLDYGYEARRLYDARGRRAGSLSTFSGHQLGRDPLVSPGEVDLTAHVNWDDLRAAASDAGWVEIGLWSLAEFLVRAGISGELEDRGLGMEADLNAETISARQEVKRLLDPEGMGSDLKVLVQASGTMIQVAQAALTL